jgi:Relaxase/Mobilisation nuclease domain
VIPRINVGKGVTGAVQYVLGQGRDAKTGELNELAPGEQSRVDWVGGTGFKFDIESQADIEIARRVMEFDAMNQTSPTRICQKDCVHLSLAWARGETPTREDMESAGREALTALGMGNAKALFVAHNDEDYAHVHTLHHAPGDRSRASRFAGGRRLGREPGAWRQRSAAFRRAQQRPA